MAVKKATLLAARKRIVSGVKIDHNLVRGFGAPLEKRIDEKILDATGMSDHLSTPMRRPSIMGCQF